MQTGSWIPHTLLGSVLGKVIPLRLHKPHFPSTHKWYQRLLLILLSLGLPIRKMCLVKEKHSLSAFKQAKHVRRTVHMPDAERMLSGDAGTGRAGQPSILS